MTYENEYDEDMDDAARLEIERVGKEKRKALSEAKALERRLKNQQVAYRPIPSPESQKIRKMVEGIADALSNQIEQIDALIEQHALGLRLLQPPVSGKIDVRWWKPNGQDGREPVLVKWEKDARRAGKLQPRVIVKISGKIVSKGGPFEPTHKEVEQLVYGLARLFKYRAEVKEKAYVQILPVAGVSKRLGPGIRYVGANSTKAIAQGLCNINLNDGAWDIPETYRARMEYEEITKLAAQLERKTRFID